MSGNPNPHVHHAPVKYGKWYTGGLIFIWFEAAFSVAVVAYAIYMALTGSGGITGGH